MNTPCYLIYEDRLLKNMRLIKKLRDISSAKSLLALKCFSTWCVFDLMKDYMDGITSSSLYEVRLGYEKFGKEVHSYCVGYKEDELVQIKSIADKIIFNSVSQLKHYYNIVKGMNLGIRVNPGISYSHYDLADPARQHSRLGIIQEREIKEVMPYVKGFMFHFNCENKDFNNFKKSLSFIAKKYDNYLKKLEWISLGGGIAFTSKGYPFLQFARLLKDFSKEFNLQVYLEPGEAAITNSAELVTSVVDVVNNDGDIAILDVSMEAHMLDHLIYRTSPKIAFPKQGKHTVMLAGRSCLAGDVFGLYSFSRKLKVGDIVRIADAAGYTMVKKNWFNGLNMPSICVKRLSGKLDRIKDFYYLDYVSSLS